VSEKQTINVSAGLRTEAERLEGSRNQQCFERNPGTWESKLENFPKYVRRQNLIRFISLYEIFKQVLHVKGSVIECGVHQGFGLMTWAKLSAILEPMNLTRRIYGFDTFAGFPEISELDQSKSLSELKVGELFADSHDELQELARIYDSTRFIGHVPKISLVRGDATQTIPRFVDENPHLLVSLLFLDFDLYNPTKVALETFLPRMPRGGIVAFDELDNPRWPGETRAMLDVCAEHRLKIERLEFDPYIGFAVVD
jgi:hypothetical protein